MLIHAFFAATSNILFNLKQNPTSPSAIADLTLTEPVLHLLETLARDPNIVAQSGDLARMRHACNRLNSEAREAVHNFSSTLVVPFAAPVADFWSE